MLFASAAWAQHWEAGVLAGGGLYVNHPGLSSPAGSAAAGIGNGPAFGVFLVQNLYSRLSGEIRYVYQRGDLQLSSGGRRATFGGDTHALHYDWVLHTAGRDAKVRPFLAAGAGFKLYRGIGTETLTQPLEEVALLTRASEWKPLVTVGAGVAIALSESVCLRLEFRDYMTPFPKRIIAPVTGAGGGWLHDLVPTLGLSIRF
jgi:opacity protein-like surface antigen